MMMADRKQELQGSLLLFDKGKENQIKENLDEALALPAIMIDR